MIVTFEVLCDDESSMHEAAARRLAGFVGRPFYPPDWQIDYEVRPAGSVGWVAEVTARRVRAAAARSTA